VFLLLKLGVNAHASIPALFSRLFKKRVVVSVEHKMYTL